MTTTCATARASPRGHARQSRFHTTRLAPNVRAQSRTEALGDTGNQIDAKLPANTIGFETGQTHPFAP